MPAELPEEEQVVGFSKIASIGKKHRPLGYDPKRDLFVGDNPALAQEDASQCDLRIGMQHLAANPHKIDKLFRNRRRKNR